MKRELPCLLPILDLMMGRGSRLITLERIEISRKAGKPGAPSPWGGERDY